MEQLAYRTRGESRPDHKQKVYYTAHPTDFDMYFELLSGEVLRHSNCAVWYREDPEASVDADHWINLEQMHLLVIPLTARFLAEENIALQEFRYALSQHIPVLPIAVESGLEAQFARVCGNIQYIDRTDTDVTALGYHEKISRFLSSVLISDETMQRIRDAFDACIFLSYRKKDRVYAQKLMRLIHGNDACRDIAVWYDEYLMPGEDFNDAIAEAMCTSDAFALMVTPSLLEEGNYVQQIEYPFARKLGKHILPFEMLETERSQLLVQYEGLMECVSADERSITERLLQTCKELAIQPKERDSRHNFFIGLAYLTGVLVEQDRERAAGLIRGAAEDGLPEAMEKMVDMYREGEGLERNYDEAIKWQLRYVGRLKEIREAESSFANADKLYRAITELILLFLELRRYEEADARMDELMDVGVDILREYDKSYALMCALYLQPKITQSLMRLGKKDGDMLEEYGKCCEFCKTVHDCLESELALQMMSQCYLEMGRLAKTALRISVAREFFEKSIEYSRYLYAKSPESRYCILLALALVDHADVESLLNRHQGAERELLEALKLMRTDFEERLTPDACSRLAELYIHIGDLYEKLDRTRDAEKYYSQAAEQIDWLSQHTVNLEVDLVRIDLLDSQANLYRKNGDAVQALECCVLEENLVDKITGEEEVDVSLVRWRIFAGKGKILAENDRIDEAMALFEQAYQIGEELSARGKTLREQGKILRYSAVVLICEYAEKHCLKDYLKKYRKQLVKKFPGPSAPNISALKMLWAKSDVGGISINPLTTVVETMGDAWSWADEGSPEIMGIQLKPVLEWLRDKLYIWRIPFYPVLALTMLLIWHFMNQWLFPEVYPDCRFVCLPGQAAYQCLSSLGMAGVFWAVHASGRIRLKKTADIVSSLLLTALIGGGVLMILGWHSFIPDVTHGAYLILPHVAAFVGWITTMIVDVFLRVITKE